MDTYKIMRFYSDGRKAVQRKTGLSLMQAQTHCNDPETSSSTATKRNICTCDWFDGYTKI